MVNEPLIRPYFFWWGYVGGKRGGLTSHNMSQVGFPESPSCVPAMRKDMVPQDTLSFKRAEWVRSTNQPVTMAGDQLITLPETNRRWNITILNRKYIYKWWIFHCHDSFREGNLHRFMLFCLIFVGGRGDFHISITQRHTTNNSFVANSSLAPYICFLGNWLRLAVEPATENKQNPVGNSWDEIGTWLSAI